MAFYDSYLTGVVVNIHVGVLAKNYYQRNQLLDFLVMLPCLLTRFNYPGLTTN